MILLGLAVCTVAILQIEGMDLDARRVVEESREQVALTRVLTTVDALSAALDLWRGGEGFAAIREEWLIT